MNTDTKQSDNETTRQYYDRLVVLRQRWCDGELDGECEDASWIYVGIKKAGNDIYRYGEEEDKAHVKADMLAEGYAWKGEIGWRDY